MCAVLCGSVHEQGQSFEQGIGMRYSLFTSKNYQFALDAVCLISHYSRLFSNLSKFLFLFCTLMCIAWLEIAGDGCDSTCDPERL